MVAAPIKKAISQTLAWEEKIHHGEAEPPRAKDGTLLVGDNLRKHIEALRKEMLKLASELEFEQASELRDEIHRLEGEGLGF